MELPALLQRFADDHGRLLEEEVHELEKWFSCNESTDLSASIASTLKCGNRASSPPRVTDRSRA